MRNENNIDWEGHLCISVIIAVALIYFAPMPAVLAKLLAGYAVLWGGVFGVVYALELGKGRGWLGCLLPFGLAILGIRFLWL